MATTDGETAANRLSFGRFVLDLTRGSLLLEGREVSLRPKTFAVLRFLAENPERLISKEELLAAVWPNLIVTDDTLVQSIGELRRALGDSGATLIITVPRRGYRFVPSVAPGERRNAPGAHPLRWRWKYGLIIPFALIVVVAGLWLTMRVDPDKVMAASEKRPAIAVLPFQNQSEPALDYLSDGLTQDLIQSLGRFS